eukprot:15438627-Alexandrium_andersonii.AAC.1
MRDCSLQRCVAQTDRPANQPRTPWSSSMEAIAVQACMHALALCVVVASLRCFMLCSLRHRAAQANRLCAQSL